MRYRGRRLSGVLDNCQLYLLSRTGSFGDLNKDKALEQAKNMSENLRLSDDPRRP